jgi:hypothetical protein
VRRSDCFLQGTSHDSHQPTHTGRLTPIHSTQCCVMIQFSRNMNHAATSFGLHGQNATARCPQLQVASASLQALKDCFQSSPKDYSFSVHAFSASRTPAIVSVPSSGRTGLSDETSNDEHSTTCMQRTGMAGTNPVAQEASGLPTALQNDAQTHGHQSRTATPRRGQNRRPIPPGPQ